MRKAAVKPKPTPAERELEKLRALVADQQRAIAVAAAKEKNLRARIKYLECEVDEWDDRYQVACVKISGRYAALDEVRGFLRRNPPDIAEALWVLAEELD